MGGCECRGVFEAPGFEDARDREVGEVVGFVLGVECVGVDDETNRCVEIVNGGGD